MTGKVSRYPPLIVKPGFVAEYVPGVDGAVGETMIVAICVPTSVLNVAYDSDAA
jgi:ABC-type phosphate transport system permease subunit